MKARLYGRCVILLLGGIAAAVVAVILVVHSVRQLSSPPPEVAASPQEVPAKNLTPSLYCVFYDFLHEGIVVGFDFAVALPKGASPRFDERAEGTGDVRRQASTPIIARLGLMLTTTTGRRRSRRRTRPRVSCSMG